MNSKSNFTPGPWKREGRSIYALNDKGTNRFFCHVHPGHIPGFDPEETQEANAHLIAAAPRMYDALKAIADMHVDENTKHAELSALCIAIAQITLKEVTP